MAKRSAILGLLGGTAAAVLLAAAPLAQKAPDPLVGTWRVTGHNVFPCEVSYPTGTLEVSPPPRPGGDYPVRLRQSWRTEALPGCPEPRNPTEAPVLEGELRRRGNLVALVVRNAEGRVLGPWGYEMEGQSLRFLCERCVKTSFRWVRQGR